MSFRFAGVVLPRWMPLLARRTFAYEMIATLFFTLAISMIEGGVISVFARQTFDGIVPQRTLNFSVALLGSMNELANILSFIWNSMSAGRRLVPFINILQVIVIGAIGLIAFLPGSPWGLALLVAVVMGARLSWSGMITMRTGVWRANYPPNTRARIVGLLSSAQMVIVSLGGAGLGFVLDRWAQGFRLLIPIACVMAMVAVWSYGRIRVRREYKVLRDPGGPVLKPWQGPLIVWRVLQRDRRYAQFMLCMFILGFGNLMLNPVLVIALREQYGFGYFNSILITSAIPSLVQVVVIPLWARFLDRSHVVRFRSIHSWVFVCGSMLFVMGAAFHQVAFMYAGAIVQGCAYAGGALAWNLGHVDFSPPSQTSQYMATHVTLNGLRGLLAPLFSVMLFEVFKAQEWPAATMLFAFGMVINAAGAAGFVMLRRSMGAEASRVARGN